MIKPYIKCIKFLLNENASQISYDIHMLSNTLNMRDYCDYK